MSSCRLLFTCLCLLSSTALALADPLPSWRDGPSRTAITTFVESVTDENSPDFVPEAQRIATFDNDGTLWSEQPLYFQAIFAIDRVKALASSHPEWKTEEPFASILKGDLQGALSGGESAVISMIMATHANMTTDEFADITTQWMETARHPATGRRYSGMVFQPMLELLGYLRSNGFKTFIVSGGGIEFMRPWTEAVYGIPPEQVVGSSIRTQYVLRGEGPVFERQPELFFFDDKEGKPVAINHHIGRRPILAVGNSDGDFQMLEYTTTGEGARLGVIIHHTDAQREWAYDRESHIGRLGRGLDEADERGWIVVDMKDEWATIYPTK